MKPFLYIILIGLVLISCQREKEETSVIKEKPQALKTEAPNRFEENVYKVLNAFKIKSDSLVNELINPDKGVMIIYRTGVFNEYRFIRRIDFKKPVPANFPYPDIAQDLKLQYDELPKFNCGTMEWDKYGLYCDTIRRDTLLSGTPQNLIKYRGDSIPLSEVEKLQKLESNSRRVVLAQHDNSFIFYLTLIDNKWYLTAIDRITTDCSA